MGRREEEGAAFSSVGSVVGCAVQTHSCLSSVLGCPASGDQPHGGQGGRGGRWRAQVTHRFPRHAAIALISFQTLFSLWREKH